MALFCKNDMNLAAEEKIDGLLPLAAAPAFGFVFSNAVLPKTRVGVSDFENQPLTGASAWLSSTSRWGCGYRCDGTASVSLVQRFYASSYGRFNTPDPYRASGGPSRPASWNRYSYALGDPVNRLDPRGLQDEDGSYGSPQEEVGDDGADGDPGDLSGGGAVAGGGSGDPCTVLAFQNPTSAPCISTSAPVITVAAPAPPDCGQALASAGILPGSTTGIALSSTLLGENSWSLIGNQQYQNGDSYGHPTGLTITAGTVAQEDNLMLDVIANLASAHGLSQLAQVQAPGVFLGYAAGTADFASYQLTAVGSSKCKDLTEVSLADDSFAAGGSVARTSYNQFRGVVQVNRRTHKKHIRHQNSGDARFGGTDFFTVANP